MTADAATRPRGQGLLVVVAGPSGVGKGTVLRGVLERVPDAEVSVSATTRPARPGEVDGVHYHFLDRASFEQRIVDGGLLEWASYAGNLYGTPRREVDERVAAGAVVILEIEVQGAQQVRRLVPDALLVFLAPPDMDELERRLRGRETETPAGLEERLRVAREEMTATSWFDLVVVNDDLERAQDEVVAAIEAARAGRVDGGPLPLPDDIPGPRSGA